MLYPEVIVLVKGSRFESNSRRWSRVFGSNLQGSEKDYSLDMCHSDPAENVDML